MARNVKCAFFVAMALGRARQAAGETLTGKLSLPELAPLFSAWSPVGPVASIRRYTATLLSDVIGEELVFFSFLYIKLLELGVEVAFNNRIESAVTYHKVNLLKFPLQSSNFERTDDAFVLLICFCFFHLYEPRKGFEHIELPAKLLDYFLRNNESNINHMMMMTLG
jgi:hypothetical protein